MNSMCENTPTTKKANKESESNSYRSESSQGSGSMASLVDPEPAWPRTWRAYACLVGCFFLMFNSWGLVNAYGTFATHYNENSLAHKDQLEINAIGSTQSGLVLLFSAPIGRFLDAGHSRIVIGTGAILVPFGMFMLSIAHPSDLNAMASFANIWATQGLVVGLGMACFFVSSSQIAATWFHQRKGFAVGFVACGASIAGVVYPAMLRYLVDSLGFNQAVRMVTTLTTLTCVYSLAFCTPDPKHAHYKPQSYRSIKTYVDPDAFGSLPFCFFTIAVAFLFFGFYPVFFNLEDWALGSNFASAPRAHVLSETDSRPLQSFWLLTIMNGCSTIGRLIFAAFADRTGPLNMHIGAQLISSLLLLILWSLAGSTAAAITFCVLFGITSGTVIGLPPASMANILIGTYGKDDHRSHKKLGTWVGTMYSFAAIPAVTGPLIAGHLITQYNTYLSLQMWAGANLFFSAMFMLLARWYLPCADGERIGTKLARMLGKQNQQLEKGKQSQSVTPNVVSPAAESSRLPTLVPTRQVSSLTLEKQKSGYATPVTSAEKVV